MKQFRYALASISYHKYLTLFTLCFFSVFTFFLTTLLNLCHIEKKLLQQLAAIPNSTLQISYHQQMLNYYQTGCLWVIGLFAFSFLFCFVWFLVYKKEELKILHLNGFSNTAIVKQCVYEVVSPALLAFSGVLLLVLLFQNTYNYLLLQARLWLAHSIQIPENSFYILNSDTADFAGMVSTNSVVTIKKLDLFALDGHTLTPATTLKDWLTSSSLLLLLTLCLLVVITCWYLFFKKKKWRYWL